MKKQFTGQCMCGSIAFESSGVPIFQANCHCDDCRRSGGGVYASFAFVAKEDLVITKGQTAQYQHSSDSGSTMTKHFCHDCGTQLITENSNHPERRGIRIGAIDDASWFQPMANVYVCKKLPSTPLDDCVNAFEKMPG